MSRRRCRVLLRGVLTGWGVAAIILLLPGAARAAAPTCTSIGTPDSPLVTTVGTPLSGPIPCNDPDGDALTYTIVSAPAHGTLTLDTAGQLDTATYTPDDGFAGLDSLQLKANDGTSDSNVATVTIDVDTPPTCDNNHKTVQQGSRLTISLDTDFLCDDVDPGASVFVGPDTDPAHGTLLPNSAGTAEIYTPDSAFVGTDSFSYSAADEFGVNSNEATMTITVTPEPVVTPTPTPKPVVTPTPTPNPGPTPDTTPPTVALMHPRQTIKNARAKGVALTEASSEAGTLHATVSLDKRTARKLRIKRHARGAVVIGTLTQAVSAGRTALHVTLSAKARKALKQAPKVKLLVTVSVTDAAGNRGTKTLRVTLKR